MGAYVGGANNNSGVTAVATIAVTYTPTPGNIAVIFIACTNPVSNIVVKDNLGNTLSAGPNQATQTELWYQSPIPAGVTSYVATWTGNQVAAIILAEYSGFAGADVSGNYHGTGTSASPTTGAIPLLAAGDWVVAGFHSQNTLTASVGNQRQQITASTARPLLQDNTGTSPVTNTCTQTSAGYNWCALILGGTSAARDSQDVSIVVVQPTTAKARESQDIALTIAQPTTAKARDSQEISIAVTQITTAKGRDSQEIILVLMPSSSAPAVTAHPQLCINS